MEQIIRVVMHALLSPRTTAILVLLPVRVDLLILVVLLAFVDLAIGANPVVSATLCKLPLPVAADLQNCGQKITILYGTTHNNEHCLLLRIDLQLSKLQLLSPSTRATGIPTQSTVRSA